MHFILFFSFFFFFFFFLFLYISFSFLSISFSLCYLFFFFFLPFLFVRCFKVDLLCHHSGGLNWKVFSVLLFPLISFCESWEYIFHKFNVLYVISKKITYYNIIIKAQILGGLSMSFDFHFEKLWCLLYFACLWLFQLALQVIYLFIKRFSRNHRS